MERKSPVSDVERLFTPEQAMAFVAELMVKHDGRLAKYFHNKGLQSADALNASQELFLKASRAASKWTMRPNSDKAWLFSMAKKVALSHLKTRILRAKHETAYQRSGMVRTISAPLGEAIAILSEVRAAIDLLPETQQVVIELHCEWGYSHDEVADLLKISRKAVTGRLGRARLQLRKRLSLLGIDWTS
jgi:RNA polymerase sigma factor (sigma-70 family)